MRTLLSLLFLFCISAHAASVSLVWTQSTTVGITGNKIYYGTASNTYSTIISNTVTTNYTVTNLLWNTSYFFNVTAVSNGVESPFTTEVNTNIAVILSTSAPANVITNSTAMQLTASVSILGSVSNLMETNMVLGTDYAPGSGNWVIKTNTGFVVGQTYNWKPGNGVTYLTEWPCPDGFDNIPAGGFKISPASVWAGLSLFETTLASTNFVAATNAYYLWLDTGGFPGTYSYAGNMLRQYPGRVTWWTENGGLLASIDAYGLLSSRSIGVGKFFVGTAWQSLTNRIQVEVRDGLSLSAPTLDTNAQKAVLNAVHMTVIN